MADPDNKPTAARDESWLELLQLHRTAVQQSDSDISALFEQRLREYREKLLSGTHQEAPLTPEAILDFAGMHGLISPRRQQRPPSQAFNEKLIGLVCSALAGASRAGTDARLAAPAPAIELANRGGCEDCKWSARAGEGKCEGCSAIAESVPKPAAYGLTNGKLGTQTAREYWMHELRGMARTRRAVSAHIRADPEAYEQDPIDVADGALQDAYAFEAAADLIDSLNRMASQNEPQEPHPDNAGGLT